MTDIWFPVAPGITTLPPAPTVVDTSPNAVIGSVATVGINPQTTLNTAFPGAIIGDGVQDESNDNFWVYDGAIWENVGANPGPTITANFLVPIYNEKIKALATTRATVTVKSIPYKLQVLKEPDALVLQTLIQARRVHKVNIPVSQIYDIGIIAPVIITGFSAKPNAVNVSISANIPLVSQNANINVPAVSLQIDALEPYQTGPSFTAVEPGSSSINLIAEIPAISTGASLTPGETKNIQIACENPAIITGKSFAIPVIDILVNGEIPEQTGPDPVKILPNVTTINISTVAPVISSGVSNLAPVANISLNSLEPFVGTLGEGFGLDYLLNDDLLNLNP